MYIWHILGILLREILFTGSKVITSLNGQCLHARVIGFGRPITEEYIEITSDCLVTLLQF